jgi:hypothetical protein
MEWWVPALVLSLAVLLLVAYWLWPTEASGPPLGSFKQGKFCYPCSSPIDAQFGDVLFIAGKANVPNAQRRFFLHNTSKQTMTVRSFTFGGYDRRFKDQVTEMIDDKLMRQYGYSNVVPRGQVFSLDPQNDAHVMYKGWYNAPLFIAYTLGAETDKSTYGVIGWAPMRLQDETTKYRYFYDEALKKDLLAKIPKKARSDMESILKRTAEYTLARNAAIHWETGAKIGEAKPLGVLSNDSNTQCQYVTTVNTFDSVNVHVPLAHLSVAFKNKPGHGKDAASCLRDIATVASATIMNASADLDNFMQQPDESWAIFATVVATSLWFYVELSGIAVEIIADVVNIAIPGAGTALSVIYGLMDQATRMFVGSGVLAQVPGIGNVLNDIGMQFANGNKITDIAEPFTAVLSAAATAAAGDLLNASRRSFSLAAKKALIAGLQKGAKIALVEGAKQLGKKFPKLNPIALDVLVAISTIALNNAAGFVEGAITGKGVEQAIQAAVKDKTFSGNAEQALKDILAGQYKGAAAEIALIINDNKESLIQAGVEATGTAIIDLIGEQISVAQSQLFPQGTGRGAGKEGWKPGTPGKQGYALSRKLWVNSQLAKMKFAKDAACWGDATHPIAELSYFN